MRVAEERGSCDINLGILRRTRGDEEGALATTVGSLPGVISGRFGRVTRLINVGVRKEIEGKSKTELQRMEQLVAEDLY